MTPKVRCILLSMTLTVGCASTPDDPAPPPPESTSSSVESSTAEEVRVATEDLSVSFPVVYFDTDSSVLPTAAREALTEEAKTIIANPEWGVVNIDGHCDERGSGPYNMTLGLSRARAVERFLLSQGVPQARLALRSFGEGRPAAVGRSETAWKQNRRAEVRVDVLTSAAIQGAAGSLPH